MYEIRIMLVAKTMGEYTYTHTYCTIFAVLVIDPWALCMPDKQSTTDS